MNDQPTAPAGSLKISELFYSLQGEGARAGVPSIFIRLSGCDLACGFCDTEFESGKAFTLDELRREVRQLSESCKWIVWTGGEPMLQLTPAVTDHFRALGYKQACESNGNNPIPKGMFDWVVVSPKVAEHVLAKNFPDGVDELRYVRHAGQPGIPVPAVKAIRHFLSPRFAGDRPDPASIAHCTKLCLENPHWALSLQSHKLLRIL